VRGWGELRTFSLALNLPRVEDSLSWGRPVLKAHGKLWTWWSPNPDADAPVFKVDASEREFLLEHRADVFFTTHHYAPHPLLLMRPEAFDADWARTNLLRVWRAQAPKRFLKEWDANNG
jgi:hypothetical protein